MQRALSYLWSWPLGKKDNISSRPHPSLQLEANSCYPVIIFSGLLDSSLGWKDKLESLVFTSNTSTNASIKLTQAQQFHISLWNGLDVNINTSPRTRTRTKIRNFCFYCTSCNVLVQSPKKSKEKDQDGCFSNLKLQQIRKTGHVTLGIRKPTQKDLALDLSNFFSFDISHVRSSIGLLATE